MRTSLKTLQKDYPLRPDLDDATLDRNTSLWWMLQMIGRRKDVLDFGCATGYLAKLMSANDCNVVGVEANAAAAEAAKEYCSRVFMADLDFAPLSDIVEGKTFDVMVFGDVLEHLRHSSRLLDEARSLLRAEGYVVASIPNIAHGAIRLALLGGEFDYSDLGILDDTHLRFFTLKTVEELFLKTGYEIRRVERTKLGLFDKSDLIPQVAPDAFSPEVLEQIQLDPEFDTLQFIVQAFPLNDEERLQTITRKFVTVNTELASAESRLERQERRMEETKKQLAVATEEMQIARQRYEELAANPPVADQQAELQRLQAERDLLNGNLAEQERRLNTIASERDAFKVEVDRLRTVEFELRERVLERQSQVDRLQEELSAGVSERDGFRAEIDRLQAVESELRESVLERQSQVDRLQAELSAGVSELDGFRAEIDRLQAVEFELRESVLERQSHVDRLQAERDFLAGGLADLEGRLNSLALEHGQVISEKDRLGTENSELRDLDAKNQEKVQALETEWYEIAAIASELRNRQITHEGQVRALEAEWYDLATQEMELRAEVSKRETEIARALAERDESVTTISEVEGQLRTVVAECDSLVKHLQVSGEQIDANDRERDEMAAQLLALRGELQEMSLLNSSLSADINDLKGKFLLQTDSLIDRTRRETRLLSTLIENVQNSRFWKLKSYFSQRSH